ncbi:MAG: tetratricopeptide repeat protein [Methanospirillaceae archaeon]|nr:tetratricopeptide repeat protein [Methanospirillaceae archaeon]
MIEMKINYTFTLFCIPILRKALVAALLLSLFCVSLHAASSSGGGRLLGLDALEIMGILFNYESGDTYRGTYQGHEILFNSKSFVIHDTSTGEEKKVQRSDILYPEGTGLSGSELIWNRAGSDYLYEALKINNPFTGKKSHNSGEAGELNNRGTDLYNEKRYEEAILSFEQAVALDPAYAKAWNNMGLALNALGQFEEAEHAYNQAIVIDSSDAIAWSNLCRLLSDLGRYDEAMDACNTSIGINEGSAKTWNNMGLALYGNQRYEEAVLAFDKSLGLDPGDHAVLRNRNAAILDDSKASVQLRESREPGEVTAKETPKPLVTPRETPAPKTIPGESEVVCDCSCDSYDCASFKCRDKAQQCYEYCIAQGMGDVHNLEGSDNDGKVCESWPPC